MEPTPEDKKDAQIANNNVIDSPLRITKLFKKLRIDTSDQDDLNFLPVEVINLIYFYMDRSSAFKASQVCRFWYECGLNYFKTWIEVEKVSFAWYSCTLRLIRARKLRKALDNNNGKRKPFPKANSEVHFSAVDPPRSITLDIKGPKSEVYSCEMYPHKSWFASTDSKLNLFLNFKNDDLWRITFHADEDQCKFVGTISVNLRT